VTGVRQLLAAQRAGGGLLVAAAGALSLGNLLLPGSVKAVLGLPLAFWAPGYCMAILIFGYASWTAWLDGLIRLAAECVLSMAAWPPLVLLAYTIHPKVTASSVECCFLALVIATLMRIQLTAGTVSRPREKSTEENEEAEEGTAAPHGSRPGSVRRLPRAPIAAVAVIVLGSGLTIGLAYTLPAQQGTTASAVSLAGAAATADTPLARDGAQAGEVSVTIYNPAPVARDYRITATVTGAATWTAETATVAPGSQGTVDLVGALPSTACLSRVSIVVSDSSERLQPLDTYFRGNESGSCDQ
jgi:hypothetical protein